ncbi:hypothetical protein ACFQU2_06015 [Siccirubricoccus deserti]
MSCGCPVVAAEAASCPRSAARPRSGSTPMARAGWPMRCPGWSPRRGSPPASPPPAAPAPPASPGAARRNACSPCSRWIPPDEGCPGA